MASADVDAYSRPFWQDPSELDPTRARASTNNAPPGLADLFNYDVEDINDVSRAGNAEASATGPAQFGRRNGGSGAEDGGLGIDEEVKVRKRRAPIAKLDEERLLSANGIPKLRRITKERLRFKGKGHEFSDVARLLNIYQLWLDDLFPKAKFADGLAIIEKLGHKKRLQVMRKEWIDEEKPPHAEQEPSDAEEEFVDNTEKTAAEGAETARPTDGSEDGQVQPTGQDDIPPDDDLYAEHTPVVQNAPAEITEDRSMDDVDEPDVDELDALLAEEDMAPKPVAGRSERAAPPQQQWDDFADEEEAMRDVW